MKTKAIRNERGHRAALKAIEALLEAKPGTRDGAKLERLANQVESYEEKNHVILPPTTTKGKFNIKPRISLITLGISDLKRSRRFYEALGWKASRHSQGDVVFFKSKGSCLALYPSRLLAKDAKQSAQGSGFRKLTLAQNVRRKGDVAMWLALAKKAGGRILKPAQDVFWGGHSGYYSDPDGHLWEVAWNPFFKISRDGDLKI